MEKFDKVPTLNTNLIAITLFPLLSKMMEDLIDRIVRPILYVVALCFLMVPLHSFWIYLLVYVLISFSTSGIGFVVSIMFDGTFSSVVSVVVPLLSGFYFAGRRDDFSQYRSYLSYSRWAFEVCKPEVSQQGLFTLNWNCKEGKFDQGVLIFFFAK